MEIAKDLISAGANLYAKRNDGFTALHVAAKNNQPRITEVLVDAMDDLDLKEVKDTLQDRTRRFIWALVHEIMLKTHLSIVRKTSIFSVGSRFNSLGYSPRGFTQKPSQPFTKPAL